MQRTVKNSVRKSMAIILAVAVALTYSMPMTVFAGTASNTAAVVDSGGETLYDKDGKVTTTPEDAAVTMSKTIKPLSGDNEFEITLKVLASQEIITKTEESDAATVLVMDVSGSMTSIDDDWTTRLDESKVAAKTFLETYVSGAGIAKRMVAVVEFGSSARTVTKWIDANGGDGKVSEEAKAAINSVDTKFATGITREESFIYWPEFGPNKDKWTCEYGQNTWWSCDLRGYHKASDTRYKGHTHQISEPNDTGGTNIEGGLMLTRNLMTSGLKEGNDIAGIGATSVVMLTDGVPTFNVADTDVSTTETSFIKGTKGGNNEAFEADYKDVPGICQDIKATNEGKTSVYTIAYGLEGNVGKVNNKTVANWLTNDVKVTANYSADNAKELFEAFSNINESIEESITTEVVVIDDPMGEFILFDNDNELNERVTFEGNLLRVGITRGDVLDESGKPKLFTYSYKVKLDTAAQKFVEGQDYATNGTTTLTFRHPSSEEYKTVEFKVPRVKGKIPVVPYTVEYYKWDKVAKAYLPAPTEIVSGDPVKLWSQVNAPSGYKDKYNCDNYHFEEGDSTIQVASAALSENVIRLYYMPDLANVTVNHHYKTDVIKADGTEEKAGENDYGLTSTVQETGLYAGGEFEAQEVSTVDGVVYAKDGEKSGATKISSLNVGNTTINLYYYGTRDERAEASVTVNRIYETGDWKLDETTGKYVEVFEKGAPQVYEEVKETKAHSIYSTSTTNGVTAGYVYKSTDNGSYSEQGHKVNLTLSEGENTINLTFVKHANKSDLTEAKVIVKHNYWLTEKKISGGALVTTVPREPVTVEEKPEGFYANESFTPSEVKTHDSLEYVSDGTNADKIKTYTLPAKGTLVIELDYRQTKAPAATDVIVNRYYRTYDKVVTDVVDEETGEVTGQKVEDKVTIDYEYHDTIDTIEFGDIEEELYVGYVYKAPLDGKIDEESGAIKSYEFNVTDSTPDAELTLKESGNVIDIYYDYKEDTRAQASIEVHHIYTVKLTTVEDGKIVTKTVIEGIGNVDYSIGNKNDPDHDSNTASAQAGDIFTVAENTEFNDNIYTMRKENNATLGDITLKSGTNRTIEIVYEREASDLKAATLSVVHKYIEKIMTIVEGVAGYYTDTEVDTITGFTVDGGKAFAPTEENPVYAGFKFKIDLAPKHGDMEYTPDMTNPGTDITLAEGENERIYTYNRETPLPKTTVTVNHHYSYTTIDSVGGTKTETSNSTDSSKEPYVGADVKVTSAMAGYDFERVDVSGAAIKSQGSNNGDMTLTTSTGAVTVDYYYTRTTDHSVKASYEVNHYYRTLDWNDSADEAYVLDENVQQTGNSFATLNFTAVPNFKPDDAGNPTFDLTKVESDADLTADYTMTLGSGENVVNFYYTQKIDSRVGTVVEVIHNYYKHDTSGLIPDATIGEETSNSAIEALPGVLAGSYTEVFTGKTENAWVENSFTAQQKPVYNELTYGFKDANPTDLTIKYLKLDDASRPNLIVINYVYNYDASESVTMAVNHVYRTHNASDNSDTETINTVSALFGNNDYGTWDKDNKTFEAKAISNGYTRQTPNDGMTVKYNAGENEMTVIYSRVISNGGGGGGGGRPNPPTTNIPDADVPLADAPVTDIPIDDSVIIEDQIVPLAAAPETEVEIVDEPTPLAALPKTGGMGTAGFFGFGLAFLALGLATRRREDKTK